MKVLSVRKYKAGYEVRTEEHVFGENGEKVTLKSAFTPSGDYIGSSVWAHRLIKLRGIRPEKVDPGDNVCSIGFCEADQKWYGWSHRALYGFGIGDTVKEGDLTAMSGWTDEYLEKYPEEDRSLPIGLVAETLGDAKKMAIAFAEAVG